MIQKYAVMGMDVEDWFHLDYFEKEKCNTSQTAFDGLNKYLDILKEYNIKTTLFVVAETVSNNSEILKRAIKEGHEIGIHTQSHQRPLTMSLDDFKSDVSNCIQIIREELDYEVKGFRAPCFSLDSNYLQVLIDLGLKYDASKIDFGSHKLYGNLDVSDFSKITEDIFKKDDFYEFETSTLAVKGRRLPISGGGYLRIFPWQLTRLLVKEYFKTKGNYFFYIHPFELSNNYDIKLPDDTPIKTKIRFHLGRKSVPKKIRKMIDLLRNEGYRFVKFEELVN